MKYKLNTGRFDGTRGARPVAAGSTTAGSTTAGSTQTTGRPTAGSAQADRPTGGAAADTTSAERRDWPAVGVVIPTRNRPELLRKALDAVRAQDYPGPLRVIVVFDQAEPD